MAKAKGTKKRIVISEPETTPVITEDNIFERGVLLNLTTKRWQAKATLASTKLGVRPEDQDVIRAVQDLIDDKDFLEAIKANGREAKRWIHSYAIPTSFVGMHFIPKEFVNFVNDKLTKVEAERRLLVQDIEKDLDKLKNLFKKNHPDLYDESKYPSPRELGGKCRMTWTWRVFSVPNEGLGLLTPEMVTAEKTKFKADIQEMKDLTVALVGEKLLKGITSLQKQCTDGKVNAKTVNSINTLLGRVDEVFNDFLENEKLRDMLAEVKKFVNEKGIDTIKDDTGWQKKIAKKIEIVANELENLPEIKAKRAIDL